LTGRVRRFKLPISHCGRSGHPSTSPDVGAFHLVALRARRKEYHMTGTSVSAVTAYSAHREWASRPPDERFASVHALYDAARVRRSRIDEHTIDTGEFRTEADGEALTLRESSSRTAPLTHWSF